MWPRASGLPLRHRRHRPGSGVLRARRGAAHRRRPRAVHRLGRSRRARRGVGRRARPAAPDLVRGAVRVQRDRVDGVRHARDRDAPWLHARAGAARRERRPGGCTGRRGRCDRDGGPAGSGRGARIGRATVRREPHGRRVHRGLPTDRRAGSLVCADDATRGSGWASTTGRRGPRCGGGRRSISRRSRRTSRGSPRAASTPCACFLLWEAFQPEPGPRGHRDARPPGVGGRRRGTRRADARAHAVHRAHERGGLDPGVGAGRHGARRPVPRGVRRARGRPTACATGTRTPTSCARRRGWRARRPRRSPGTGRCGRGTWATRTPTARSRRIGRPRGDGWRRRPARSVRPIPRRPSRSASTWRTWRRIGTSARRRPREACDFLTMHGYPIYAAWSDGPTDELLVPFLARVTRWLGGGADVLFSEFGLPDRTSRGAGAAAVRRPRTTRRATRSACSTGCVLAGCTGAHALVLRRLRPADLERPSARRGRPRAFVRAVARGRLGRSRRSTWSARSRAPRVRRLPTTAGSTSTPTGTGSDPASSSRACTAASRRRRPASA